MHNFLVPIRTVARILHSYWLACAVAAAAIYVIGPAWPRAPSGSFDQRCEAWDRAAVAAVAALVAERDAIADRKLGDAVFRLRRARNNCRYDFVNLARLDYHALTRAQATFQPVD